PPPPRESRGSPAPEDALPRARSFDHRELADVRFGARRFDLEEVEPGGDVEVVLGAQVPGHGSGRAAVLAQRLHQLPAHRIDADHAAERDLAELDAALAAARDREA